MKHDINDNDESITDKKDTYHNNKEHARAYVYVFKKQLNNKLTPCTLCKFKIQYDKNEVPKIMINLITKKVLLNPDKSDIT